MTRDAEQNAPTGVRTNPITVHVDLNSQRLVGGCAA